MELTGQHHDLAALHKRKEPTIQTKEEAGWGPGPVQIKWQRKKSLHLPGIKAQL
jgi:hypothetical protein